MNNNIKPEHTVYRRTTSGQVLRDDQPNCPIVAVIDPENVSEVMRLRNLIQKARYMDQPFLDSLTDALREYADPTPPIPAKPVEPLGLGAVIEDRDGIQWVRSHFDYEDTDYPWWGGSVRGRKAWIDIDAVEILSEGVSP